ncbi:MAG: transcriptional regulator [Planctomycetota bacterium]|nr:MAG: transcriptional regulator [Planctomycetota bacterium]
MRKASPAMSDDMPELTENDFARMITRAQRQRLLAGTWQSGDLVALRRFLGLTQEQFAIRIGISVDTLQNWEQDRWQPDSPALLRLLARHPRLILQDLAGVA